MSRVELSTRGQAKKAGQRMHWRTRVIRMNGGDTPLTDVEIGDILLGSGSFAATDVRVAHWCGTKVAAKSIRHPSDHGGRHGSSSAEESSLDLRNFTQQQRRILQECHLLGQLRHPNIAQVFGVFIRQEGGSVIISELLGESLQQRLAYGTRLTHRDIVDISLDVLNALRYLHTLTQPIPHGSVSSSNTLFSITGAVKLTDANVALARLQLSHTPQENKPEPHFIAPAAAPNDADTVDVFSSNGRLYQSVDVDSTTYDLSNDTFSFGILVMAMALHKEPTVEDPATLQQQIFGSRRSKTSTAQDLEKVRREEDLKSLSYFAPLFAELVHACIEGVPLPGNDRQDKPDGIAEEEDEQDGVQEQVTTKELIAMVQDMRQEDEYARWPSTKSSPFVRSVQEQSEMVTTIRRLEAQVKTVVQVAQSRLAEQEKQLEEQVEGLKNVHKQHRQKLHERIRHLEDELNTLENEIQSGGGREQLAVDIDTDDTRAQHSGQHTGTSLHKRQSARSNLISQHEEDSSDDHSDTHTDSGGVDQVDAGYSQDIHVKVPGGSLAVVRIDSRNTVGNIVQCVCAEYDIPNFEEYSLLVEEDDPFYEKAKKEAERTKKPLRDKKKMESIKQRLKSHSVPAMNWLQHDKTLQEQGIDPTVQSLSVVKHTLTPSQCFAVDGSTDLDLEYKSCKTAILDSSCLCPIEDACTLAALQCCVEFGRFPESSNKQKLKTLQEDIKDFLPKDFQKTKTAKSKILAKYSNNSSSMNQVMAKSRYIDMCKSLPTYGATVFVVKTPAKSRSKMVPCILVITRDNVLKLEEKSKEVLEHWQIKKIRRWVQQPETIQIDVGENDPISFMTHESGPIANLISMYKGLQNKKTLKDPTFEPAQGEPLYAELATLKSSPSLSVRAATYPASVKHHSGVTRSESTILPRSPRITAGRRISAEAPAFVSLTTAKKHSPLLERLRSPVRSPPPTYDVLEPQAQYSSTAQSQPSDYMAPRDDYNDMKAVCVDSDADDISGTSAPVPGLQCSSIPSDQAKPTELASV